MKTFLRQLLLFVTLGTLVHGQGSQVQDQAIYGGGVPGASVLVCQYNASPSIPCTPTVTIYSDRDLAGGHAISNPTTADGAGNYNFFVAPGIYTIQISSPITTTLSQTILVPLSLDASGKLPNSVYPTPTRAGDLIYYNGTNWVTLAGNNSGTLCLQENSSGVPSWVACGGGGGGLTGTLTSPFLPRASGASTLVDSGLSESGGALTITDFIVQNPSSSFGFFDFTRSFPGRGVRLHGSNGSTGIGGEADVVAGDGGSGGAGGNVHIDAGSGGATGLAGGSVFIAAGQSPDSAAGAAGNVRISGAAGASGANILLEPGFGGIGTACTGCRPGAVLFAGCTTASPNCNTDNYGSLDITAATTFSYTFFQTYSNHPNCILTPMFDLNTTRMWITYTGSTAFTANFSAAVTGSVSYHCWGHV